ncbi:restriction endonuclease subunit S [Bacillus mycoides]|uniref:restriction endonuclease subunit S n=1 Tax=Bacillus mycoides TaxID=1405 RepID=UPI002E1B467E|nr:restriction endonuclease subunit S [Bacillus mycoides]MED1043999.1 restriction endonuclease subunit S [Bacillus mycoides]
MVNEVRKGYKRTEIGEIPIEWEVHKGFIKIRSGFGFKLNEYTQGGIPLIRINNIKYGKLDLDDVVYLPEEYLESYSQFVLGENDLLLALNRPITQGKLKISRIEKENTPAILYQRIGKLEMDEKLYNSDYIYYYLQSKEFMKLLEATFVGSDQPFIKNGEFAKLPIVIPSLQEQSKIVSILSSVDETIEKTEAIIEQTEKVKKGLMQQLLTKGIGHTKFKKTEIGETPEEWEVKTLGTIGTWSGGGTPSKQEPSYWSKEKQVIWVSPKDMYSNIITSSEDYITEKGLREKKLKLLPKGTILFVTRSGILRNRVPIALAGDSLTINQDLKALQVASNIDYDFIFYTLLALNDSIRTSCVKTGTTVESIDFQSLKEFLIPVPTLSEQKEIVKIIGTYYKKLENEKGYLEYLGSFKKGLMQLLLTGKVRVKVDEAGVAHV